MPHVDLSAAGRRPSAGIARPGSPNQRMSADVAVVQARPGGGDEQRRALGPPPQLVAESRIGLQGAEGRRGKGTRRDLSRSASRTLSRARARSRSLSSRAITSPTRAPLTARSPMSAVGGGRNRGRSAPAAPTSASTSAAEYRYGVARHGPERTSPVGGTGQPCPCCQVRGEAAHRAHPDREPDGRHVSGEAAEPARCPSRRRSCRGPPGN